MLEILIDMFRYKMKLVVELVWVVLVVSNSKYSFRSNHWRCSVRNFATLTGKHLCQSLFLVKLQTSSPAKMRLWHRCFPVNFAKFLRTPFFKNTSGDCFWLLTNANLKNLYWWCHSIVLLLTKEFFSQSFHSCKLFPERVSCAKNGT